LIEVQQVEGSPLPLAVRVGDVLLIHATGGRARTGEPSVELWGPYLSAVVADTGSVLAPMGPPNVVLVRARKPGSATLDVFTGDPWHAPRTTTLGLTVEA
jgi:hypothetical protein